MSYVGCLILVGLSCMFVPSKGQIILPPGGNSLIVLNGSTVTIEWSINSSVSAADITYRSWSFKSSGGGKAEQLGIISGDGTIMIITKLYEVDIKEPATLVLKNVNGSYNGKYTFALLSPDPSSSEVVVVIAAQPNVIINCSNPVTVNEGDDFTCVCRSKGGNPPANLTWYKDGEQIGNASYGENILTLTNVTKQEIGTYKCVAQSYTLTDEEPIEVKVRLNFKPNKTVVTFTKNPAVVGGNVTVMCESNGRPSPRYKIFHNDTKVSNEKTYTIDVVKYNDSGTYKCIAENKLGTNQTSNNLAVGQIFLPPGGNSLTFLKNSTVKIKWSLDSILSTNISRSWSFKSSASGKAEILGEISRTGDITIVTRLYEVDIEKPATLVLKNVNGSYNGTYVFTLLSPGPSTSEVAVFIAVKPYNTKVAITPRSTVVGNSATVTCSSKGLSEPSYNITHNDTMLVSSSKIYEISKTKWSDAGKYTCIAWNKVGNDSASGYLTLTVPHDADSSPFPWWAILLIVIAVVALVVLGYVAYRCKQKEKDDYSGNADVSPDGSGGVAVNHYELDGEPAGGVDNTYDTANPSGASGSKSKPPKNTLPPVYAAVDKSKKDGKPLYATLDTIALHSDNSKKKRDEERPGQSEYASIDFGKIGKADEE